MKTTFKMSILLAAAMLAIYSCGKEPAANEEQENEEQMNPSEDNPFYGSSIQCNFVDFDGTDASFNVKLTVPEDLAVNAYMVCTPKESSEGKKEIKFLQNKTNASGTYEVVVKNLEKGMTYKCNVRLESGEYNFMGKSQEVLMQFLIYNNIEVADPGYSWNWDDRYIYIWQNLTKLPSADDKPDLVISNSTGSWRIITINQDAFDKNTSGKLYAFSFDNGGNITAHSQAIFCKADYTYNKAGKEIAATLSGWKFEYKVKVIVRGLPQFETKQAGDKQAWVLSCSRLIQSGGLTFSDGEISVRSGSSGSGIWGEAQNGEAVFWFAKGFNGVEYDHVFKLETFNAKNQVLFKVTKSMTVYPLDNQVTTLDFSIDDFIEGTAAVDQILTRNSCGWVQLWDNGPKFATFNLGSRATTYSGATTYSKYYVGGLYTFKSTFVDGLNSAKWAKGDYAAATKVSDLATSEWGSKWREGSSKEWSDLINNTTISWCSSLGNKYMNGCDINGFKISGKKGTVYESHSIFLPAAGMRRSSSESFDGQGSTAYLWTSETSADLEGDPTGKAVYFSGSYGKSYSQMRYHALSIRPVLNE